MTVFINGRDLTVEQVIRVCRDGEEVKLTDEAIVNVKKARAYIERKLAEKAGHLRTDHRLRQIFQCDDLIGRNRGTAA